MNNQSSLANKVLCPQLLRTGAIREPVFPSLSLLVPPKKPPRMKFVFLPLVTLFSLLSFSSALPIVQDGAAVSNLYIQRDVSEDTLLLEKRENERLTNFLASLNRTGAGVFFMRNAANSPGINTLIIRRIADLIREEGLEELLKVADKSGIALDLVMLILTHFEVIDGVTEFTHYYRDTDPNQSGSLILGLIRFITGNLFGGGGSSNSTSTSGLSSVFGLLGGSGGARTSGSSSSGGLSSLFSGLGSAGASSGSSTGLNSTGSAGSSESGSGDASDVFGILSQLGGDSASASPATTSSSATTPSPAASGSTLTADFSNVEFPDAADDDAADKDAVSIAEAAAASATGAQSESTSSGTSGGFASLASDVSSLFKREMDDETFKRESDELVERIVQLAKRQDDDHEEEHGDFTAAYEEGMSIMEEEESSSLGLMISLQKSGLGISVIHDALTDSRWHTFNGRLIDHLSDEGLLDTSELMGALVSSGVIWSTVGSILGNTTYVRNVIDFVRGIFTGDVNLLGLLRALFA